MELLRNGRQKSKYERKKEEKYTKHTEMFLSIFLVFKLFYRNIELITKKKVIFLKIENDELL